MICVGSNDDLNNCRMEKLGCEGCNYNRKEKETYKLCYVNGNKAWFTNNFEHQWGDDWDDRPYEHNAGEPYDSWSELIEDNEDISKRKYKDHPIKLKTLYFETNDWSEKRSCDGFLNSPYSVEDINKQAVAWIHTDKFNILAGTTYEDFIKIIQRHNGEIYTLKEKDKWR